MRQISASRLVLSTLAFLAMTLARPSTAAAAPVVITFEEIPLGFAVLHQFASRGVTFNQPICRDYSDERFFGPNFAHSGVKGIEQCFAQEFCTVPIEAAFTAPQRQVKAWVGFSASNQTNTTVVLDAFNAQGQRVGQDTVLFPIQQFARPINTPLEVIATGQVITRVNAFLMFEGSATPGSSFLALDDLEYDTEGPPPPCNATVAPALTLVHPAQGFTTQGNAFLLQGLVTSQTQILEANVTVTGAGGATYASDLIGRVYFPPSGPVQQAQFGPTSYAPLFPGSNLVTMRVGNCFGAREITRTVVSNPLPSNARIVLDHIEVTQSVQFLDNLGNNRIELIAGKRTVARVYLRSLDPPGGTIQNVSGLLFAERPEGGLPGGPATIRSLNVISVGPDPDPNLSARRVSIDGSLNFELPPEWITEGGIHLQLSRVDVGGVRLGFPCENCENQNEFNLDRIVRFHAAPPLRVVLFSVPYTTGGTTFTPRTLDFDFLESWLRRAYPTAEVQSTRRQLAGFSGVPDTDFEADDVNSRLHALRCACPAGDDLCSDGRVHWYGVVSDAGGFLRGLARDIPGTVASGPAGSGSFGWDLDGSYADWYGGHELAHTYGRRHPGFCGESDDDDDYPYTAGIVGRTGFDVGDPAQSLAMDVKPGGVWHDVTTYCDFQWLSDYTYLGILDYLRDIEGSGAGAGEGGGAGAVRITDAILIQGEINLTRNQASLRPFLRYPDLAGTEQPAASPFAVELRNAAGAVLARHLIDPAEDTEVEPGEDLMASFDLVVRWLDGTQRIVLLNGARELASRAVSTNAPQVRLVSPNGPIGAPPSGILDVRWTASDADGDTLTYALFYSADGGQRFEPLDAGLTAMRRDVPLAELHGASQALFRVVASDGVNTTMDDQDAPMVIAQKPPAPRILSPGNGATFASGEAIVLMGEALDLEDGHLDGAALEWSLDAARFLGEGRALSATGLAPGAHQLTLSATDSAGASATVSISVEVSEAPLLAVIEAETPVALGTEVRLDGRGSQGDGTLRFAWTLASRPPRSTAVIADPSQRVARLRVDAAGDYEVELVVSDASRDLAVAVFVVEAVRAVAFLRGEVTGDGAVDISDAVRTLGWLFSGQSEPTCLDAVDGNDDGRADISDPVFLLGYLFLGGPSPARPFPDCGVDPTADGLGCARRACP